MTLVTIALANKSNPARYKQGGAAQLLNCYVEKIGPEGKAPWAVYASDGLQGYVNFGGTGGIRAQLRVDSNLFVVVGVSLYKVDVNQSVTLIGAMNISTTAPVYLERNRRATPDVMVVCDGLAYYYRTTFQQVTDIDLLAPTSLAFIDGYFIIGTVNNTWQAGTIDDASAWSPLSYTRADANPDAVVRVAALQRDAVIFGEVSTEFHRNTGSDPNFPFDRVTAIDIGCLSANSVTTVEQTLAWVAHDRTVRMLNGYTAEQISSPAVCRAIETVSDPSTIRGTSWVSNGHTFYSITSSDWTWDYDTSTKLWHERASYGQANWKISCVAEFDGKLIAGDATEPILYEMGPEFADEAGSPLVMSLTLPPVHAFPKLLTFNALFIDCQQGVGTGQGDAQDIDPELMLEVSRDGGATFTTQRTIKLGQQGQNLIRTKTYRLGQAPEDGYTFRLSCSAKVARAFYGLMADVESEAA